MSTFFPKNITSFELSQTGELCKVRNKIVILAAHNEQEEEETERINKCKEDYGTSIDSIRDLEEAMLYSDVDAEKNDEMNKHLEETVSMKMESQEEREALKIIKQQAEEIRRCTTLRVGRDKNQH